MPATSQQQQKLFGLALSVKRGDTPRSEVSDDVLNIVDTMSEKDIKDFAETSHSGLPKKIESYVRELVRETFRNKVLDESKGNPKYKVGDVVNYLPKLSGLNPNKKLKIVGVKYRDGDDFTTPGWYYSFNGTNLNAIETDIKLVETLGEIKFDSNGNLKIKKQYDSISDYEKVATKGDHIWFGKDVSEFDDVKSGVGRLSKVVGRDSEGNVIFTPYSGKTKFTIPVKKWKVIVVESINEAPTRRSKDFFEDDNKYGIELHKLMRGKWDRNKALQYFIKLQSDKKDTSNIKNPNEKYQNILYFIATGLGINGRSYKSMVDLRDDIITAAENLYKLHTESINEEQEQLDEKLITFSNRAPYGQVVFIAGGAGSGKGFAIENFIDSSGYKVRDVDEMKKQIQKLNAIGKLSIQQIIDKFGSHIAPKDLAIIKKIQDDGYDLKSMNLKNPNHVYALHILVDAMGIKDKTLENMLAAKSNPETLPNIIFDITAKKITSITEVLPMLHSVGYKPNNIHLVWILTDYEIAIKQNAERARVVPADIMLGTHVGAGNTVWGMVTSALPKGMNGRVDVILNNQQNTVFFIQRTTDKKTGQKKAVVSGFLALPVKKQGGPILPEKMWKDTLYNWIKDNGPKELTANF